MFETTDVTDSTLRVQILSFTCSVLRATPIPPLHVIRPLLHSIIIPSIDSPKCAHSALTATFFFTFESKEAPQRESYLLEVFQCQPFLASIVEHANRTAQIKISEMARKVIENLSNTTVKDYAEKLLTLDISTCLKSQLLSHKPQTILSAMSIITNIGATSKRAVQNFLETDVYVSVCRTYARICRKDLVREAVYNAKHAIIAASGQQLESLIHAGILLILCDMLLDIKEGDVECVEVALTALYLLLNKCPSVTVYDEVIRIVLELNGWKLVDRCRNHKDARIKEKADRMNVAGIRAKHWK